jgi:hypothetical protein
MESIQLLVENDECQRCVKVRFGKKNMRKAGMFFSEVFFGKRFLE